MTVKEDVHNDTRTLEAMAASVEGMQSAEDALDHLVQMALCIIIDRGDWTEPCVERTIARCFWRLSGSYFQEFKDNAYFYRDYKQEQKQ